MKAFGMINPGELGFFDAPKPILEPRSAICNPIIVSPCTSDVHNVFHKASPTKRPPNWIFGHECVAKVVEVGSEVKDFAPGDIVAVSSMTPDWRTRGVQEGNITHPTGPFSGMKLAKTRPGVFCQYIIIDDADTTLAKVPEGVSLDAALMCADMVNTGFTGVKKSGMEFGDSVCVIGIGPVGLMAIAGAAHHGAGRIFAVGHRTNCAKLAKEYGANDVIDYTKTDYVKEVLDKTNGVGVDVTIIAGGNVDTIRQALEITKYGVGTVVNICYLFGDKPIEIPVPSFARGLGGKTIRTEHCEGGRVCTERLLDLVKYGRLDPTKLITHRYYGFDKIPDALYAMRDKPDDLIKTAVYIDWDKEMKQE